MNSPFAGYVPDFNYDGYVSTDINEFKSYINWVIYAFGGDSLRLRITRDERISFAITVCEKQHVSERLEYFRNFSKMVHIPNWGRDPKIGKLCCINIR